MKQDGKKVSYFVFILGCAVGLFGCADDKFLAAPPVVHDVTVPDAAELEIDEGLSFLPPEPFSPIAPTFTSPDLGLFGGGGGGTREVRGHNRHLECGDDEQCNDKNPCTINDCMNNFCQYIPIPGCIPCIKNADCQTDNPCIESDCVFQVCHSTNIPNCINCGGTVPTCGGECPTDFACGISGDSCECLPIPLSCGDSPAPICGGSCPQGHDCTAGVSGCSCFQAHWSTSPTTIDSSNASSPAPLVVDINGNVTSVWLENYVNGDDPQSAYFSISEQEWDAPQPIELAGAGLSAPQLVVDAVGTVTMVWIEYYSENANSATLFASRSNQGGTWTTPVPLNSLPAGIPTNAVATVAMIVDNQNNVTIAWLEQDLATSNYAIGSARFVAEINSAPTLYPFLDGASPNANSNIIPKLVVDQSGYVTAMWQEQVLSGFAVQAARLPPTGVAWSSVVNLNGSSLNANGAIMPQMVVDSLGAVTVVWQEKSGAQFAVETARFVPESDSWVTYTELAPALANAEGSLTPQIVVADDNSVTLVAVDANFAVWPSSFSSGASSWTYPLLPLNNGSAFSLTPLSLVADDAGIVTTMWLNESTGLFVQAARGFSSTWSSATNLDAGNGNPEYATFTRCRSSSKRHR